MKLLPDLLRQVARIARTGHGFFVSVYPRVDDAQARMTIAYLIEVKAQLVADLGLWLPLGGTVKSESEKNSPAARLEQMYAEADAYWYIRGDTLAACAHELGNAEVQLLHLVARALELAPEPELRDLLGTSYSQLVICREALWRLQLPAAA